MLIIIRNVSWAANQHIRMISEGSCDTEDWSNDAENSAAHQRNKLHFTIYEIKDSLNCNVFSQYYCSYCIFDQINAALVSIRGLLKAKTILPTPNCLLSQNLHKSHLKMILYNTDMLICRAWHRPNKTCSTDLFWDASWTLFTPDKRRLLNISSSTCSVSSWTRSAQMPVLQTTSAIPYPAPLVALPDYSSHFRPLRISPIWDWIQRFCLRGISIWKQAGPEFWVLIKDAWLWRWTDPQM